MGFWSRRKGFRVFRRDIVLEPLEERIVLDAAVDPAPQDNPDDNLDENQDPMDSYASDDPSAPVDQGDPASEVFDDDLNVVLLSDALDRIDALRDAAVDDAEIIVYDAEQDDLDDINALLSNLVDSTGKEIGHLAVVSHGGPGMLLLAGDDPITWQSIAAEPEPWQELAGMLADDARIDLYGCNIGLAGPGSDFVDALAEATGAAVWASDDMTGSVEGADWDLEVRSAASAADYILDGSALASSDVQLPADFPPTAYFAAGSTQAGVPLAIQVFAHDPNSPSLFKLDGTPNVNFEVAAEPDHGTLSKMGAPASMGSGVYTQWFFYTPDPGYAGTDYFQFAYTAGFHEQRIGYEWQGFQETPGGEIGTVGGGDSANTRSVDLGDFDGDGFLDLVVGNDANAQSTVYFNQGLLGGIWQGFGTRAIPGTFLDFGPVGDDTYDVMFVDIDDDNDLDIITANYGPTQTNKIYFGDGLGGFDAPPADISGDMDLSTSIAVGDLDNADGDFDINTGRDIVIGNYGQPNRLYFNDGGVNPTFTAWDDGTGVNRIGPAIHDWDRTTSVQIGYMDYDDALDEGGALPVPGFDGTPDSQVWADIVVGNYNAPNRVYLGFDSDLTTPAAYDLDFGWFDPWISGGASLLDTFSDPEYTESIDIADVDHDGDLDVVVGNSGFQYDKLFLNNTDPLTEMRPWIEIVKPDGNPANWYWERTGETDLLLQEIATIGDNAHFTSAIVFHDVDIDYHLPDPNGGSNMYPDVVASYFSPVTNSVFVSTALAACGGWDELSGAWSIGPDIDVNKFAIAVGDINGDGTPDAVVGIFDALNKTFLNLGSTTEANAMVQIDVISTNPDQPTALGIPDQSFFEDTDLLTGPGEENEDVRIDLSPYFVDNHVPLAPLTYEVTGLSNPTIFDLVDIDVSDLVLDFGADQSGEAFITIRATDASSLLWVEDTFTLTLTAVNDVPTTSGIPDGVNLFEDLNTSVSYNLYLYFDDAETADGDMIFSVTGNTNPQLFTSVDISNPQDFTLTFAENAFGSADVTVRATDEGGYFVESTFNLEITPVNDAPTPENGGIPDYIGLVADYPIAPNLNLYDYFEDVEDGDSLLEYYVWTVDDPNTVWNGLGADQVNPIVNPDSFVVDVTGVGQVQVTLRVVDRGSPLTVDVQYLDYTFTVEAVANSTPTIVLPGIPDVDVNENSIPRQIDLSNYFDDVEDGGVGLTYTISDENDPNSIVTAGISGGFNLDLTFTPWTYGFAEISILATDSVGQWVEDTFTVTVNHVNSGPPTMIRPIDDQTYHEDHENPHVIDLTQYFEEPDGGPLTYMITAMSHLGEGGNNALFEFPPAVPTTEPPPGKLETPMLIADPTQFIISSTENQWGVSAFDIEVSDRDGESVTDTFTISVSPVADAPIAANWSGTGSEDVTLTLDEGWDGVMTDPDDAASGVTNVPTQLVIITQPEHGTMMINGSPLLESGRPWTVPWADLISGGALTFQPDPDWNGVTTFIYKVRDDGTVPNPNTYNAGNLSDAAVGFITIAPVVDPAPTAEFQEVTVDQDSVDNSITIRGNDPSFASNAGAEFNVFDWPENGTLTLVPVGGPLNVGNDGAGNYWAGLLYSPDAGYVGPDSLEFAFTVHTSRPVDGYEWLGFQTLPGVEIGTAQDNTRSIGLDDLNNDGFLDLVVGNMGAGPLGGPYTGGVNNVYMNDGAGNLVFTSTFGANDEFTVALELADVDGDDFLDVITGNAGVWNGATYDGGTSNVYLNDGAGGFNAAPDFTFGAGQSFTTSIAVGDVDGDGDVDVVEGNNAAENILYLNDGTGAFTAATDPVGGETDRTRAVAMGDVDRDGVLDVVVGNYDGYNKVYKGNGDGTFADVGVAIGADTDYTEALALADLNSDGYLDLVVGNSGFQTNKVYLNDGGGGFGAGVAIGTDTNLTFDVRAADVDGDNDVDIIVGDLNAEPIKLYLNNGSGSFSDGPRIGDDTDAEKYSVALGDVDGDGAIDLVAGVSGEVNKLYLNDGFFSSPTARVDITVQSTVDPNAPTSDGIPDVTVVEDASDTVIDLTALFTDNFGANDLVYTLVGNTNESLFAEVGPTWGPIVNPTNPNEIEDATQFTLDYAANASGNAGITIRATDLVNGLWVDDTFDVTVVGQNDAPVALGIPDVTVPEGTASTTINLYDYFEDPDAEHSDSDLTYEVHNVVNGSLFTSLDITDPQNFTINYTPSGYGQAEITIRVTDPMGGGYRVDDTFTVTVQQINDAPTVENGGIPDYEVALAKVGPPAPANVVIDLYDYFDDAEQSDDTLTYTVTSISNPALFDLPVLGGIAAPDAFTLDFADAGVEGISNITIQVEDWQGATVSDTFQVTVLGNVPPEISGVGIPDIVVDEDAADYVIDLSAYFTDQDDDDTTLTYSISGVTDTSIFSSTTIVDNDGDTYVDDLVLDFAANAFGASTITVRCTDPYGDSVFDSFLVTVNSVNDPPTTTGVPDVTVYEDAPDYDINLTYYFDDVEDGAAGLSYYFDLDSITNLALFESLQIDDGVLTLGFAPDVSGVSLMTVLAYDSDSAWVSSTFQIEVIGVDDAPQIRGDGIPDILWTYPGPEPNNIFDLGDYFFDPDAGDTLTYEVTVVTDPTFFDQVGSNGGVPQDPNVVAMPYDVDGNGFTLEYLTVDEYFGTRTATITIRATDTLGSADSVEDTFTVTIIGNDAPTITPPGLPDMEVYDTTGSSLVYLNPYFQDAQDDDSALNYFVEEVSDPNNVLASWPEAGGELTLNYTGAIGTATVRVRAEDTDGAFSSWDYFDINVIEEPAPPYTGPWGWLR